MSFFFPLRIIAKTIVELLFPHCCLFCDRPFCLICNRCRNLLDYSTQLESAVYYPDVPVLSVCRFTLHSRRIIHRYKYAGITDYGAEIALLMYNSIALPKVDYISAVPPDPFRKKQRGFDHTMLIAQKLSQLVGIPYMPLLKKVRQTKSLASTQTKTERTETQNPFEVLPAIISLPKGTRILLVDDVCTTGTTLRNCLQKLSEHGMVGTSVVFALRV